MSIFPMSPQYRYVIVSPVKDEEQYVEFTLRSVTTQTLKPILWLIVDDGSSDHTREIIDKYLSDNPFIKLIRNPNTGQRLPGAAVIRAFNYGLESMGEVSYDFIVKLDCDLSFDQDYFEVLLGRFDEDQRLGIASGVYLQPSNEGNWMEIRMPSYHAAGASKVIRRQCFEEIGGFITAAGWDTVDEIRAMNKGWKTGHLNKLRMKHHKHEGTGIGFFKTSIMHGKIYYLTRGSIHFFILKCLHRIGTKPYGISALALLYGYFRAVLMAETPLVTKTEAHCYQSLLNQRLRAKVLSLFT